MGHENFIANLRVTSRVTAVGRVNMGRAGAWGCLLLDGLRKGLVQHNAETGCQEHLGTADPSLGSQPAELMWVE